MYSNQLADSNLRALANVQDINTITATANGILSGLTSLSADKRARVVQYFYDKMLLDTLKLGAEHNIYLRKCETKSIPEGHTKLLLRRWGGLTEHTVPLKEGIPPISDRVSSESFTGTFSSFGRYMEFSDWVDFMLIDPVIMHYTKELGDVAVRTAERLCRQEMIRMGSEVFPAAKTFGELKIGDNIGIADYRLMALKMKRLLIDSNLSVICSPEHIYDLVTDELVKKYMEYTNSAEPYKTGKPVDLFGITFEETMLDDFAYGYELANPGEWIDGATHKLRVYSNIEGTVVYSNLTATSDAKAGQRVQPTLTVDGATVKGVYLKDGSFIPDLYVWRTLLAKGADTTALSADVTSWTAWGDYFYKYTHATTTFEVAVKHDAYGELNTEYTVILTKVKANSKLEAADDPGFEWRQLPVHKSFMLGKGAIIKTGIGGRDTAKMYIKAKGSAGVLDPIDQRQSIGFKIDTLGFTTVRPEAIQVFYFVPSTVEAIDDFTEVYFSGASITKASLDTTHEFTDSDGSVGTGVDGRH